MGYLSKSGESLISIGVVVPESKMSIEIWYIDEFATYRITVKVRGA